MALEGRERTTFNIYYLITRKVSTHTSSIQYCGVGIQKYVYYYYTYYADV